MESKKLLDGNPEEDLGYLIFQLMKIWQRGKHKTLDEYGMTASQMETMSAIYHLSQSGEEVNQITVSNLTNIDPMTTSTILRNLQKKGWVNRKASETDTRARVVEMTNEGEEIFCKAMMKVKASTEILYEAVDTELLKRELKKLLAAINELSKNNTNN